MGTEMHSMDTILHAGSEGQVVMETNLLFLGGDRIAVGSLYPDFLEN